MDYNRTGVIQSTLEKLFSKQEAQIYLYLLENPDETVYQISKSLNISRSSIYPVVDAMYTKGMLFKNSCDKESYFALDPETLLKKLQYEYNKSIEEANDLLKHIKPINTIHNFLNINGYESVIEKAKEILRNSIREVYMNMDVPLEVFDKELSILEEKNVRVIFFSFAKVKSKYKNVEVYSHNFAEVDDPSRIMIVSDLQTVFIANNNNPKAFDKKSWIGTYSNNLLLIQIVSEHIHHDIYLYEIYNKTNIDFFNKEDNSILLSSLLEKYGMNFN